MLRSWSLRAVLACALLACGWLTAWAQPAATLAEYEVYTLKHKPAAGVERVLSEVLSGYGTGVHLVSDARSNRILLRGPQAAQQVARQVIAVIDQPPPAEASRPAPQQVVRLTHSRATQIEPILRDLLGPRLKPLLAHDPQRSEYQFTDAAGRIAQVSIDWQRDELTISGPASLVSQWTRLVQALDSPPAAPGVAVRIMPLRRADRAQIREAVETFRSGTRPADQPRQGSGAPEGSASRPDANGLSGSAATFPQREKGLAPGRTRLVAYLFQGADAAEQPPVQKIPAEVPKEEAPLQRRPLRELGLDVEVEMLPDLDAIILRGPQREVEQLRRIIEEIERLSAETQPAIDLYLLRHVNCEPLAALIAQVSPDLVGGQQGRVSITPLVKPNGLLLIGWGEAVRAIKELIAKLDQPVAPQTQFAVFRLRYAPAGSVLTAVEGFFAGRTGLGPQAKVIADARTNSLIVQAAPRDLAEVQLLIERLDQPQGEAVRQARVFKLLNSLAADVAGVIQAAISGARAGPGAAPPAGQKSAALELLTLDAEGQRMIRAGVLDDVQITPDPRTNTLIVAAPAESMNLLAELIRQLDSPAAVAQIKVFRIVNGDATSMAAMLRSLLPAAGGTGAAVLPGAEGETSLVPSRFSVDVRTNSIVAVGSQGDLAIIEALLIRLDQDKGQQRKNTVYRLKNAPAADVARTINDFLSSQRQLQQVAPGAVSPFQQIESEAVVVAEVVSNTLIISATPRFFNEIKELVEKLDAEPPQVVIQVLIAEVAMGNQDEFGVELGIQDSVLFDRSLLGNLITITSTKQDSTAAGIVTSTQQEVISATNEPGFDFNNKPLGNSGSNRAVQNSSRVGTQGLSSFAVGRINNELGFGGLVFSASNEAVSVLIRALQESRRLEVLSRPQVMTLDNQPAFVQVGKRVPRIVGSAITQFGQQNTIMLENVGLILGVTPRTSPDGRIVMEVDAEKSELGPIEEGIPVSSTATTVIKSPSINLTTAQTTVGAVDGETIIIGGLITKSNQKVQRRVPWLADVPLLGILFRYDASSRKRTEMLIILTPHIIRSPEDAERLRQAEEARMHWCLSDVSEVHGSMAVGTDEFQVPVVYPDSNPRGLVPQPGEGPLAPQPEAIPPGLPLPGEPAPLQAPLMTPEARRAPPIRAAMSPPPSMAPAGPPPLPPTRFSPPPAAAGSAPPVVPAEYAQPLGPQGPGQRMPPPPSYPAPEGWGPANPEDSLWRR